MTLSGLSDSLAMSVDAPSCRRCDSSSHVAGGLCVGCLLQSGLDPGDECDPESLVSALAEINLPDQNWRLGNYEILEEIGRGGMGVIYRARQRHSRRIVAVKRVLSYHSDSRETLARFRREAQAAASLDHPNILPIYEVSESEDGLPFFSMKFAPGGNLQEVGRALRNDPRQCVALVAKVARAVQYAHAKGILHRDLKPGNILLDARGEPLVSDFGLAKWLDISSDLTRTLTIFGTPGYIAPEQANGPAADLKPAADVYSLGAILFDLLAGRPPFLGAHALSVIRQAAESPAPKLRTLSKLADRDLETICARCLERDPKLRYPSAHDLAEDLERWLEGRPIIARPVLLPVRIWRWSQRNSGLTAAAGICLALGLIASVGWLSSSRLGTVIRNHEIALHSIVVTPFEDLDALSTISPSALSTTQFINAGLDRETRLHVTSSLTRFPATTVFWRPDDWRQLGSTMGAAKILTGTTRIRQGRQRTVFRVIDTASGVPVTRRIVETGLDNKEWGQVADLAASELRAAIENKTFHKSSNESPVLAAREYLRTGKEYYYRYNPADTKTALGYFTKAIEIDPECAEVLAMFALSWSRRFQQAPEEVRDEDYVRAIAAAKKAVTLDPELSVAYRAQAALTASTDTSVSLEAALCALELEPDNVVPAGLIGHAWRMLGRPDLALRWLERSARGQRPGMNSANVADAFTELGDDEAAKRAYKEHFEFWPDLPDSHVGLACLSMLQRDFAHALEKSEEAVRLHPNHAYTRQMKALVQFFARDFPAAEIAYRQLTEVNRKGGRTFYCSVSNLSALAYLRSVAGDKVSGRRLAAEAEENARQELGKAPKNRDLLYDFAAINAVLGKREEAWAALGLAVENGWIDYRSLALDPRFDSIRHDSRFQQTVDHLRARVAALRKMPTETLAVNTERKTTNAIMEQFK